MVATLFAGELRTGRILVRNIPVTAADVKVEVGGAGTISATVSMPMTDPYTKIRVPFRNLIVPGKSFLGYDEGGKIQNAGPIWSDIADLDKRTIQLNAAGIRSYWDYRFIIPALRDALLSDVPVGHDTNLTALALRTIAKRWVQQAQSWTSGSVPIVFEADFFTANERNFFGVDLKNLGEAMKQLSGVINGPDIACRPRYTTDGNHIEWVMSTGTPELTQNGPDHIFDLTVPNPSVRGAKFTRDGSVISTDDYEVGSAPADNPDAGPLMAKSVNTTLTRPNEIQNRVTDPEGLTLANWLGGVAGGTGTITLGTGSTPPGSGVSTFVRSTVSTAGTYLDIQSKPSLIPVEDDSAVWTFGFWLRSSKASTCTVFVQWLALDGTTVLGTTTVVKPTLAAATWTVETITSTALVGARFARIIGRATAAAAVADTLDMTVLTAVKGTGAIGDPFSGSKPADADHEFAWSGTAHVSSSSQWSTGGYPRMETSTDRSSVTDLQILQDYADSTTKVGEKMVESMTFTARKKSAPEYGTYSEGDYAVLVTEDDSILGTGRLRLRMMQISAKMGDQFVSITCAPERV